MSAYVYHYKIWRNRIIPLVITLFCFKMNKPNGWVIILLLLQIGDAWIREVSRFASRVCYAVKKRDVICKFKVVCFHSNTLRSQQADDFLVLTEKSSTLQLHVFPLTWSLQTSVEWHVLIMEAHRPCSWIIVDDLLFGIEFHVAKSQCYLLEEDHCPPVPWNLCMFFVPSSQRAKIPFCINAPLTLQTPHYSKRLSSSPNLCYWRKIVSSVLCSI